MRGHNLKTITPELRWTDIHAHGTLTYGQCNGYARLGLCYNAKAHKDIHVCGDIT